MSSGNCAVFQTICECFRQNCIWAILQGGLRSCTDSIHGLEGIIDWLDPQECGVVQINCDRFDISGTLIFIGAILLGLFPGIISTAAVMMRNNQGGYRRIGDEPAGDHVGRFYGFLRRIIHWVCCIFGFLLCFARAVDGGLVDEEHGDDNGNGGGGDGHAGGGLRENVEHGQRPRDILHEHQDEVRVAGFPDPQNGNQDDQLAPDRENEGDEEDENAGNDHPGNIAGNVPAHIATPPNVAAAAGNNGGPVRNASTSRIPRLVVNPRHLNQQQQPSASRTDPSRRSSRLAGHPKTNFATLHRRGRGK